MKKGIVALLVVLAVVVLVSPAIVGRIAEKSVDENLNWAAGESGELVVTSTGFERGWFSSEGQHRVEVRGGGLQAALSEAFGGSVDMPVLIIDTRLDHGLVPVTSMARERGSLAPGLGSAISTLSIETPDGETVDLPGKIFSKVALGGELESHFVLQAGSHEQDGATASWGDSKIDVTTNPKTGQVDFAGDIGALKFADDASVVTVDGLSFSGTQVPTKYGIATGDLRLEVGNTTVDGPPGRAGGLKKLHMEGTSSLNDGELQGRTVLNLESQTIPGFGELSFTADIWIEGADPAALAALNRSMQAQAGSGDPRPMLMRGEEELKRLLAGGLELRFDQLDIGLPMGTVKTKLDVTVAEEDPDTFDWSSLLLSTEASANVIVPEALVDMAMQMNPQAGAVVGMGFLQKDGDVYVMDAEYKKGLLTINGAPMPIPLGAQ